jgi:type I restriction enzyme S subunit
VFISRVTTSLLFDRLNAESNAPEMLAADRRVQLSGLPTATLGQLVTSPINNSIRNVSDQYDVEGANVPLFRPADIQGIWLNTASALRVTREFENQHEKARVYPGNIVIAAAGTVAAVARVPSDIEYGGINGSFARVVLKRECDGFIVSYLASKYGYQSMMRWAVGSVQKHLNLEDLPKVNVVFPKAPVQKYVGDKVRQAERLRTFARLEQSVGIELLELLLRKKLTEEGLISKIGENNMPTSYYRDLIARLNSDGASIARESRKQSRVTRKDLTERLDAGFYRPDFLENAKELQACGVSLDNIESLSEKCNCGATPVDVAYESDGQGLIRTSDVRPNRFNARSVLRTRRLNVVIGSPVAAVNGDLLYTMSGTIGYAAVVPATNEVFSFSNTIARARIKAPHNPWYIAAFFNSSIGYKQSLRLTSGGIQGHVMPNPFKRLTVPVPDPRIQDFIGGKLQVADSGNRLSEQLVAAAKLLVEALIERKVTEAELIDAQTRLEQGDDSGDRAILSRLYEGGWDETETRALFPDLDAYYETLRMVDQAQADGASK